MSDTFEYTEEFDVSSSLIDGVWFNENDRTVVLDVDNWLYRYSDVTRSDVEALVTASSVGAYYNTFFKPAFGPGEKLGYWSELDAEEVSVKVPAYAAPAVSSGATKEYSLQTVRGENSRTSVLVGGNEPTREYSLAPIATKAAVEQPDGVERTRVYFELEGVEGREFEFAAASADPFDAVEELNEYVSRLGTTGKVRRVVVEFV